MPAIHVLNGPNLNLLGQREPALYGAATLADVESLCRQRCETHGCDLTFRQGNGEGELISWIHEAGRSGAGIVLNAGAYTHTSLALQDAIRGANAIVVEVHITNVHARETIRHHSFISPVAKGIIVGFGPLGYGLAIDALAALLHPAP